MSRVLITGGAGFIGCRLATSLVAHGHDVVAFDNLHPQVHPWGTRPRELPDTVELIVGDVTEPATRWSDIIDDLRPHAVVHLAAETGTGQSLTEPTRHASVNVLGTAALAEGLEHSRHHVDHVLLASSRAVYGDGAWRATGGMEFYPGQRTPEMLAAGQWDHCAPDGTPATALPSTAGTTVPHPTNVYAATKLAQEHVLQSWCGARSVPLSILRLQNVYGAGQSPTNSYTGVLTFFVRSALAGQPIEVYEDGEIVRDFVHVDDVVTAFVGAVRHPVDRLLDIGSGRRTTIGEVAAIVAAQAGGDAPELTGRYRLGDVRAASCTIEAAAAELGYRPAWDLADGIAEVLAWMPTALANPGPDAA